MNDKKKIESLRNRNIELSVINAKLTQKVNTLKQSLEELKSKNELSEHSEVEMLKEQWIEIIKDLQQKREEYRLLIEELRNVRNIIFDKVPWYKKLFKKKTI